MICCDPCFFYGIETLPDLCIGPLGCIRGKIGPVCVLRKKIQGRYW